MLHTYTELQKPLTLICNKMHVHTLICWPISRCPLISTRSCWPIDNFSNHFGQGIEQLSFGCGKGLPLDLQPPLEVLPYCCFVSCLEDLPCCCFDPCLEVLSCDCLLHLALFDVQGLDRFLQGNWKIANIRFVSCRQLDISFNPSKGLRLAPSSNL